ncbi:MAG TPA: Calx-beta domain-containing protein, partial [Usitatibacter sp.]|nr:Calx-beta domain-containing protein [Usitatibacter sp.]
MKKKRIVLAVAAALAIEPLAFNPAAAMDFLSTAPITFERNLGQFEPDVLFVTRGVRGQIAIRAGEVSVAPSKSPAMRLALAGANPQPEVQGLEPKATRSNYYRGGTRTAITGVPHFGRVLIKGVYPNVDLAFHGDRDALEYDFVLAPGADPSAIRLDLSGAAAAHIDEHGDLRIRMAGGELTQRAPIAFQVLDGRKVPVEAQFTLRETAGGREAGFLTAPYDRNQPLVIDPILSYATYMGDSGTDWGGFLRGDDQGHLHLAFADREEAAGSITINRFDPVAREMLFSTRVDGMQATELRGLAVGSSESGAVTYVTGSTDSPLFTPCGACPPLAGASDAFVMAIDASGQVVGARLIGGSGSDMGLGVATDAAGNVYVTGSTSSTNFPVTGGTYRGGTSDAFLTRLSPDLETVQQSIFIGGSGADLAHAIAVNASGDVYLAMASTSEDFPLPTASSGRDVVAKVNAAGNLAWGGPFGVGVKIRAITVDGSSRPTIGGTNALGEVFAARLDPGIGFVTTTRKLPGPGAHSVNAIAAQGDNIYVAGTAAPGFVPVAAPHSTLGSSGADAFVAQFGPTGADFATLIGGTGSDQGRGIAVTPGAVYVAGSTESANFPTVNPDRGLRNGGSDGFLASIAHEISWATDDVLRLREDEVNVAFKLSRTGSLAAPASVRWTAVSGTAIAGTHYGTVGVRTPPNGIVEFPAGVGTVTFRVGANITVLPGILTINDGVLEGAKSFTIALSQPVGGALGTFTTKTITIVPDETSLTVATPAVSVHESGGVATVIVTRQGSTAAAASVNYATANGTALAGTHYQATAGTLDWDIGDASERAIIVPLIDDASSNTSRNFRVNLSGALGSSLAGQTFATITVLDDDDTLAFTSATVAANEGTGSVTLRVRRTGGAAGPASVSWTTVNGTASAGVDFGIAGQLAPEGGVLQWAHSDATEKTIVIPVLPNTTPQAPRNFTVVLTDIQGATLGTSSAVVTLADNDAGFMLSAPSYNAVEGASVTLQVLRVGTATGAASVRWSAANGTAIAGQDFGVPNNATPASGVINWAAGDATAKSIVIPLRQDVANEGVENFTVTLHTPSAGTSLGSPNSAVVSIIDDDIPAESRITFSQPKYLVLENGGTATLTLQRESIGGGFTVPATVSYSTMPGTALATSDYTTRTGTVTWDTSDGGNKTISIPIFDNAIAEPHESFKVRLASPSPGVVIDSSEATVTIVDDDDPFPRFGAVPDGWEVPLDADAGWHAANDPGAYDGVFSLRSDAIADGEKAQIQVTRDFVDGNVTFRVKISSESGFDRLRFFLDDVEKGVWSGTAVPGWTLFTMPVTLGTHTLRWSYEKDGSAAVGQDAAWIDG